MDTSTTFQTAHPQSIPGDTKRTTGESTPNDVAPYLEADGKLAVRSKSAKDGRKRVPGPLPPPPHVSHSYCWTPLIDPIYYTHPELEMQFLENHPTTDVLSRHSPGDPTTINKYYMATEPPSYGLRITSQMVIPGILGYCSMPVAIISATFGFLCNISMPLVMLICLYKAKIIIYLL
ncbi:hypothetical protein B0H13DRAFT_1917068 [Mycena leptocephala]|nr:hypothetical protein B0H13DRAFT_1917068 [Mycena leptocephala]